MSHRFEPMSATPRLLMAVCLVAVALLGSAPRAEGTPILDPPPLAECDGASCGGIEIHGPLADADGDGTFDSSFVLARQRPIELIAFDGDSLWQVSANAETQAPELEASGDFTGDGIPDYVFAERWLLSPETLCGSTPMAESRLLFVDGSTREVSRPLPALSDLCWKFTTAEYPTDQWDSSAVYVGDLHPGYAGNEVVAFPYYATEGWVLNYADRQEWQTVPGPDGLASLLFPSTDAFRDLYNRSNPTPCAEPCYVVNSHVANGVFLPGGEPALFVLTSGRAVIYRPDLTPTSSFTWQSGGGSDNGGRNYGLVEAFTLGDRQAVTLVGGCSVLASRHAMRDGERPVGMEGHCGIHRHFERFLLEGNRIVKHRNLYYSYSNGDGFWEGRVEFLRNSTSPLGGPGTLWTAFNLYQDGRWRVQVLPHGEPGLPDQELVGWLAWDALDVDGDGQWELLATRTTREEQEGGEEGYFPPWEFDVLKWDGSGFSSVHHHEGAVPRLVRYPPTPDRHFSSTDLYGALMADTDGDGEAELLLEPQGSTPPPERERR